VAERSFRVWLANHTNYDLHLKDSHLCVGEWTDPGGDWIPPDVLKAGTQAGWQSEDSVLLQGTEGWVKYNVAIPQEVIPGGASPPPVTLADEIYIHWDNPYLGSGKSTTTRSNSAVSVSGTQPDCDASASNSGGSNFPSPETRFETVGAYLDPSQPDNISICVPRDQDGDENRDVVTALVFAPVEFLSILTTISHAVVNYTLRAVGSVRGSFTIGADTSQGIRQFLPQSSNSLRKLLHIKPGR
jgi:hypothetical protein